MSKHFEESLFPQDKTKSLMGLLVQNYLYLSYTVKYRHTLTV